MKYDSELPFLITIDPGLSYCGYSVSQIVKGEITYLDSGTLTTPKAEALPRRLTDLRRAFAALIPNHLLPATTIVFETPPPFSKIAKTAGDTYMALGAILSAYPHASLYSMTVQMIRKRAHGQGNLNKPAAAKKTLSTIQDLYPQYDTREPILADELDALTILLAVINGPHCTHCHAPLRTLNLKTSKEEIELPCQCEIHSN